MNYLSNYVIRFQFTLNTLIELFRNHSVQIVNGSKLEFVNDEIKLFDLIAVFPQGFCIKKDVIISAPSLLSFIACPDQEDISST
jgi:hypothetical protein